MTITPESLPDELVAIAVREFDTRLGSIRSAIAAFLNGAVEVGLARRAKASKSYSSTKGECWIASDAWDDDWPVLIVRLLEGEKPTPIFSAEAKGITIQDGDEITFDPSSIELPK